MPDEKPAKKGAALSAALDASPLPPPPAPRLEVKSAVKRPVSIEHPWGGVELTLSDGGVVFVGNDVLRDAPWR